MWSDPGGDGGASVVVTVHVEGLRAAVSSGVERAGQGAKVDIVWCRDVGRAVAVLGEAQARGARGVPVLGLEMSETPMLTADALALLGHPSLRDLHVAVPTFPDDATRTMLWDQLRAIRAEEHHQLVEVDGTPVSGPAGDCSLLAAAAAGTLAGRVAAANRVWERMKAPEDPRPGRV